MKKAKNIISAIQAFMDSAKGKIVLNYLYSWGAAIVILGTLFKLTHIAGANLMLFVGMGTEVLVFFFSAFERPYEVAEEEKKEGVAIGQPVVINGPIVTGGTISPMTQTATETQQPVADVQPVTQTIPASTPVSAQTSAPISVGGNMPFVNNIQTPNIENIGEMDKVTEEYVEQVRALNEAIQHIAEQSETLGRNMQEMETLARNLTGMNALYEVQLRSAGGQLNSIDRVNEQTKKMAEQVEELNALYARMIEAMTTNMNRPQI